MKRTFPIIVGFTLANVLLGIAGVIDWQTAADRSWFQGAAVFITGWQAGWFK